MRIYEEAFAIRRNTKMTFKLSLLLAFALPIGVVNRKLYFSTGKKPFKNYNIIPVSPHETCYEFLGKTCSLSELEKRNRIGNEPEGQEQTIVLYLKLERLEYLDVKI